MLENIKPYYLAEQEANDKAKAPTPHTSIVDIQ
jgi:hypothetical protein